MRGVVLPGCSVRRMRRLAVVALIEVVRIVHRSRVRVIVLDSVLLLLSGHERRLVTSSSPIRAVSVLRCRNVLFEIHRV